MKEIALICPPEAENIGRLVAGQSLETNELFTLTQLSWTSTHTDIERLASSADGVVVILSDRASSGELEKLIDPFTRLETPALGLRVYDDDPVPDTLGEAQVTDLSQGAISRFIDSINQHS